MVLTFLSGFTYFPILGMLFLLDSVGDKEGWRGAWQEVCTCLRHGGTGGRENVPAGEGPLMGGCGYRWGVPQGEECSHCKTAAWKE